MKFQVFCLFEGRKCLCVVSMYEDEAEILDLFDSAMNRQTETIDRNLEHVGETCIDAIADYALPLRSGRRRID